MHSHLARNMSENAVTIGKANSKHRIRQRLFYNSLNFYWLIFGRHPS